MSLLPKKSRAGREINIVPLVDVLIVLIFFILMTMQFKSHNMLDITPPKMETAGQSKPDNEVKVGIKKAGEYYFNDTLVSEKELIDELMGVDSEKSVLVFADQESELLHTAFVMDASRKAGLKKVRLQVR